MTASKKVDIILNSIIIFLSGVSGGAFLISCVIGLTDNWYLLFLSIFSFSYAVKCIWAELVDGSNKDQCYDPYKDIDYVDVNENIKNNNP